MKNASRPARVTIVAFLLILYSLYNLFEGALRLYSPGIVTLTPLITAVLGLIAGYGLLKTRKWGAIFGVLVSLGNILSLLGGHLPVGILLAPILIMMACIILTAWKSFH